MTNSIHLPSTIDMVVTDVINGRYQTIGADLTANRPPTPKTGESFFDATLGKPIWWDGSGWVDATGATA